MAGKINFVGDENFVEEVLNSKDLVVVDFYADWCMPCRMLSPIFEELSVENLQKAKFVKVNVDDCRETPSKYQVMAVPSMIFFKEGKEVNRVTGLMGKDELQDVINRLI